MAKKATQSANGVTEIPGSPGAYYLRGGSSVVTFSAGIRPVDIFGTTTASAKGKPWAAWGNDNLEPIRFLQLIHKNNIKPKLLSKERDFLTGMGVHLYKDVVDAEGKKKAVLVRDAVIEEWFRRNRVNDFIYKQATNLCTLGNTFTGFVLNGAGQVHSIKAYDAFACRAGMPESMMLESPGYYVCNDWKKPKEPTPQDAGNMIILPAFDREDPFASAEFMQQTKLYTLGFPYYGRPDWWGSEEWIRLANEIPTWHMNGLKNGYNIRYHIEVPETFFDKYNTPEDKELARSALMNDMNGFLSGSDNNQKAFVSFYKNLMGDKPAGWKITPVDTKLNDTAYGALFDQSNAGQAAAGGIDPTLAGIEMAGKLSSGSEKRNAYNIHIALNTPNPRRLLREPFETVWELNGWDPEIKIGFEDFNMTTIDVNPNGGANGIS